MEEIGVIVLKQGPLAVVRVKKKSACDQCKSGTCMIADDTAEMEAVNDIGAEVGQTVRVRLMPMTYVKGSIVVYGIPALMLVIGAVLGKEFFAGFFPEVDSETVSALFAFGGLGISFIIVKVWSVYAEKRVEFKPVVEAILNETEASSGGGPASPGGTGCC